MRCAPSTQHVQLCCRWLCQRMCLLCDPTGSANGRGGRAPDVHAVSARLSRSCLPPPSPRTWVTGIDHDASRAQLRRQHARVRGFQTLGHAWTQQQAPVGYTVARVAPRSPSNHDARWRARGSCTIPGPWPHSSGSSTAGALQQLSAGLLTVHAVGPALLGMPAGSNVSHKLRAHTRHSAAAAVSAVQHHKAEHACGCKRVGPGATPAPPPPLPSPLEWGGGPMAAPGAPCLVGQAVQLLGGGGVLQLLPQGGAGDVAQPTRGAADIDDTGALLHQPLQRLAHALGAPAAAGGGCMRRMRTSAEADWEAPSGGGGGRCRPGLALAKATFQAGVPLGWRLLQPPPRHTHQ